jgi:hypothetical protein
MRAYLMLSFAFASLTVVACKSEAPGDKPPALPPAPAEMKPAEPPPAPPDAEAAAEAVPEEAKAEDSVTGTIVVAKARKKDVKKGDVLFLIARRAGGPPGPGSMLAVQKLVVEEFPMPFAVSSRDAMIPGMKFEGEVNLSIRLDKDGDPMTRRKGDVFGEVQGVKVGSKDVTLPLETLQTEDKVLGAPGGMAPHGGSPHGGMPAGHP